MKQCGGKASLASYVMAQTRFELIPVSAIEPLMSESTLKKHMKEVMFLAATINLFVHQQTAPAYSELSLDLGEIL